MKKILLTLSAFILTISANAQVLQAPSVRGMVEQSEASFARLPQAKKAPARAELASNERIMGPYTTDDYQSGGYLGLANYPGTYPIGAYMTSGYQQFEGDSIVALRYALSVACEVQNAFMLGISETGSDTIAIAATSGSQAEGWHTLTLDKPVLFEPSKYEAILLGFTYVQVASAYPLSYETIGDVCPTLIYGALGENGETAWYNLGTDDYGSLSVQAVVKGEFPDNGAIPSPIATFSIGAGKTKNIPVTLTNMGTSLSNIDYTLTIDGVAGEQQHLAFANPLTSAGGYIEAEIPFTAPTSTGTKDFTFTVDKVNGVENGVGAENATVSGKMNVLAKELARGVLVEEFTGTGCGWCPRGLVGMQKMRETFGDQFIGIAYHNYNSSDPMYTAVGMKIRGKIGFSSAPSCSIDRGKTIDPYYGSDQDVCNDVRKAMAELPEVGITLSGVWNGDSSKVVARADVESLVDGDNYDIVFNLIADSLRGTTTSWKQHNYYYKYSASQVGNDEYISQFCSGGANGTSTFYWPFDDVFLATSYNSSLVNQATLPALVANETAKSEYVLTVPTTTALKTVFTNCKTRENKKFAIVAYVINKTTGAIENAAKTYDIKAFDPNDASGINEVNKDMFKEVSEVARYTADGRQVSAPVKGMNIIRLSNGKTVKVIVK